MKMILDGQRVDATTGLMFPVHNPARTNSSTVSPNVLLERSRLINIFKQSGLGRESITDTILDMTEGKASVISHALS